MTARKPRASLPGNCDGWPHAYTYSALSRPGNRPPGKAPASSRASGTLIRLRGIPNIAARPGLDVHAQQDHRVRSHQPATGARVGADQQDVQPPVPGPHGRRGRRRVSAAGWAGGSAATPGMSTTGVDGGVEGDGVTSSGSSSKSAAGISHSPSGSSSPWNTAVRVSSVSMPEGGDRSVPEGRHGHDRQEADDRELAGRPPGVDPRSSRHHPRIEDRERVVGEPDEVERDDPDEHLGREDQPEHRLRAAAQHRPDPEADETRQHDQAGMAMRMPRRRSPAAYWPRPGKTRDRAAAANGERAPSLVTSTDPSCASVDLTVRSWTPSGPCSLRTITRRRNRQRRVNAWRRAVGIENGPPSRQGFRLRRRPASRRKVDAPPEGVRMLAVRSMSVP